MLPHPGPRLSRPEPARDPLVHPVQLFGNKLHHALNDHSRQGSDSALWGAAQ